MKLNTQSPLVLLCLFFSVTFFFSCSKDSDLLADYVALDPEVLIGKYVRSDTFQISIISNSEDDTFEITVNSGSGGTTVNDTYQTSSSASIVLDVLANDTFKNKGEVVISEITQPENGDVVINSDNTITYTPFTVEAMEETFTYTVEFVKEDGTVGTETGNVTVSVISPADRNYGTLKAFPTAYGAGSSASGGRGGQVIHVTNLNDNGTGSLRQAVQNTSGARTVIFDVSGSINLSTPLTTAYDDLTIAGQTAPAGGITLTGNVGNRPLLNFSGRDNIIIRYIRVRPTFIYQAGDQDAIQITNCTNVIVDHVSASWGGDETIDFSGSSGGNITIQNSIFGESAKGGIIGDSNSPNRNSYSVLGNLWYQVDKRQPNSDTNGRADVINNVIWGYGYRLNRPAPSYPQINEINNYYMSDSPRPVYEKHKIDYYGTLPQIYTKGNLHLPATVTDPNLPNNNDTWTVFGTSNGAFGFNFNGQDLYDDDPAPTAFFTSIQHSSIGHAWPIITALESLSRVKTEEVGATKLLDGSGNVVRDTDEIDAIYLSSVNSGSAPTYEYPFQMSGKQHYANFIANISSSPINIRSESYDTDNDGMPDVWEAAVFGDLTKTPDGDENGNGYTNLEEYLDLVDF